MKHGLASQRNWTTGPASWFAIGVLSTLGVGTLVWTIANQQAPLQPLAAELETTRGVRLTAEDSGEAAKDAAPRRIPQRVRRELEPGVVSSFDTVQQRSETSEPAVSAPAPKSSVGSADKYSNLRVDLNFATRVQLELLPRIGPTIAARIIADREQHGPFTSVDDLDRVRGIGPKTIEKLRAFAVVREPTHPTENGDGGG